MVESNKQQLRNEIIKYGVDNNYKAATIDKVLKDYGIKQKYNPLTSGYNWEHMVQTAPQNAIDFGRDALTFGGMMIKPAMDVIDAPWDKKLSVARDYINNPITKRTLKGMVAGGAIGKAINPVGIVPGAIIGGVVANKGPKEFANAQLSTYNTDLDTLRSGRADWRDIVQGAQNNPVYAGLDFASAGGGKLIGGISKNVGNAIPSTAPQFVRQLLPNQAVRDLNRALTTEMGNAKAKAGKNYTAYGILEGTLDIDRAELARHIMTGKSKLKGKQLTLANGIRDSLKNNEKVGVDLGLLDPNLSKADTVAQYVMQYIPRSYNLLHADYRDIILGNKLRPTAANIIKDNNLKDTIQQLIKNGEDLYNKDSIVLLTQKLANTTDPLQEVIARERNAGKSNYFDVTREIGRTTPEELAGVLDDSIKFQLDQISFASEFEGIIDNILRDRKITKISTPEEALAIKTRALKEISKDISRGDLPNLNNALSRSGIKKVIVDPLYYKSLNNLFKKPINAGVRRLLSQFKKNVLATPHWVFLNRAGNWTNNLIEGVGLKDYLDTIKYKEYIPDQLKQQTSFSAYLNEGLENASDSASSIKRTTGSTWKIPTNKIKNAIEKYKRSEKSIEDVGNLASSLYANINDYIANPMFRAEAGLELADRYANFIRQAKRMANKNNTNVENILKKAQTDNELFHKLNTEVNKSLGDYVGKNYQLPSGFYDMTSEWFPFYRFYTQTARTTARQLSDNPIRFQWLVQAPTKIGKGERERIEEIFNLNPEWYQGGVPYGVSGNNLRTMGLEPLPIQSVMQTAGNIGKEGDLTQLLNPIASSFVPALYFQRFGRPATTPRLDEMKRQGLDTSKFEPTLEEKARYLGNALLGSTSALYNTSQRLAPEFMAPFTGGIRTKYDTHPFTDIPSSYLRKLPSETMMKQLGVKTSSNYEKTKPKGKSSKRKQKRNAKFFRKKEADQNKPLQRKYK